MLGLFDGSSLITNSGCRVADWCFCIWSVDLVAASRVFMVTRNCESSWLISLHNGMAARAGGSIVAALVFVLSVSLLRWFVLPVFRLCRANGC